MIHQSQQLSKDLLAPMILGKIISIDEWVPERPPKPKNISSLTSLRASSPDLPPPPAEDAVPLNEMDQTLPLPPIEILKQDYDTKGNHQANRRNSFAGQSSLSTKNTLNHSKYIPPPAIPMRPKIVPTPIMTIQSNTPNLKVQDHIVWHAQRANVQQFFSNQAVNPTEHKVYLKQINSSSDKRITVRKRAHNSSPKDFVGYSQTPPPLKPRMRIYNQNSTLTQVNIANYNDNSKFR